MSEMAAEVVLGIALIALLVGVGVGYLVAGKSGRRKRVAELEGALEAAQGELADYKREVYGEFAQTAEKFRALDKSYHDLHRQLAQSSVALCGDAATPLLEAPDQPVLDVVAPEDDTGSAVPDEGEALEGVMQAEAVEEIALEVADEITGESTDEITKASEDDIVVAEAALDEDVSAPAEGVPTLTDLDAEEAPQRRESA